MGFFGVAFEDAFGGGRGRGGEHERKGNFLDVEVKLTVSTQVHHCGDKRSGMFAVS